MTREEIYSEMTDVMGQVPLPFQEMPDDFIQDEWALWKNVLMKEHHIPAKWRELIWTAVLSVTGDKAGLRWCAESARLAGASEDEIKEVAYLVKWIVGWGPYYRANRFEMGTFHEQLSRLIEHYEHEGLPGQRQAKEPTSI